jgi:hypothetical protein
MLIENPAAFYELSQISYLSASNLSLLTIFCYLSPESVIYGRAHLLEHPYQFGRHKQVKGCPWIN